MHPALWAAATGYGLGRGCEFVAPLGKNKRNLPQMKEGIRGRVEEGRGAAQAVRFPSPLIKPDVRISRIRLSDWLHDRLTT